MIPKYATEFSSGVDLCALIEEDIVIKSGERSLISTGIALEIPQHLDASVRPRSGLALKYGITVLNTPGTIDADYRGEIKVILINLGKEDFVVSKNMRIAQLVIAPVVRVEFEEVTGFLSETNRGEGGFGSTGSKECRLIRKNRIDQECEVCKYDSFLNLRKKI